MAQETFLTGPSLMGTSVMVLAAIGMLFGVDTFLARVQRAEDHAEAQRLFAQGDQHMQHGDYAAAAEDFRDAVAIERDNRDYRLALAKALLASGNVEDAKTTLADLLETDSTDSAVNLEMARAFVKEGKFAGAEAYYHRAVYGHWKDHPAENQVKVRFELIDILAQRNQKEELLAELLPLQDEAPEDPAARKRIARLFIAAGSPSHAADIFRDILRKDPRDADAESGLGEAEFARGNYTTAQADFQRALRLAPEDEMIRARLETVNHVLDLDPALRGLDSAERYRRSGALLQMALDGADACIDGSPEAKALLESARVALKARLTPARRNDAADRNVDLAEQIWQARKKRCNGQGAGTPLDLVLAKLAQ